MSNIHERLFTKIISKNDIYGIEPHYFNLSAESGPSVPAWIKQQTLYEIYIRAFSSEGTFESVCNQLKKIKELGISIIWLMPIFPIGKVNRKGTLGSPYAISDFFSVNPEFGTEEDFRKLVDDVHNLDMKIIIDMVPNHVAPDYKELRGNKVLVKKDDKGLPTQKIKDWTDIVDLDYTQKMTREHMLTIMSYWIREFDIDGYRCDVAGMVPRDFWEWAVPQLRQIKSDIYLLAEWESPLLHQNAFNSTYDWSLYSLMLDVLNEKEPASVLGDWIQAKADLYPKESLFLRFVENHDKERAVNLFKGASLIPFLALIFSIDGLPLIYNGQEIGAFHYTSLFERETIDWETGNEHLFKTYKILIELRKNQSALSSKNYRFFEHNASNAVLIFEKNDKISLLVLINFRDKEVGLSGFFEKYSQIELDKILFNSHELYERNTLFPYQAIFVELKGA